MLSAQHPKMIAHQVLDANPLKRKHSVFQSPEMEGGSWLGSVTDFYNGGLSQWKSMAIDLSTPQSNYINQHQLPHGVGCLSNYSNMDDSSRFGASVGQNPFSLMGTNAAATEFITSPEPISSITACSEAELFSDSEYWDSVPVLSSSQSQLSSVDQKGILDSNQVASYECSAKHVMEDEKSCYSSSFILEKIPQRRFNSLSGVALPTHGDQYQLPPNAYTLEQVSGRVRERTNSLSNVAASTTVTRSEEGLWQLLPNSNRSDKLSSGKHCGDSFHKNQIHVQKQCEIEQQEPFLLQQIEGTNHSSNIEHALRLYCYYKTMSVNKGINQSGLLNILHKKLCVENKCCCNMFQECISHFENCCYNFCTFCKPAREFTFSINSGLENSNSGGLKDIHNRGLNASGTSMVDDTPPPTKRLKIGHQVNSSRVTSSEEHSLSFEGTSDYKGSHEKSRCDEKLEVVITHEDSMCDEEKGVVMVHGDFRCDDKKDAVIRHEDFMWDEKKDVLRMEEASSSEAHIQAKEKEKIHNPEVPIQATMTDQFLSPEGTFPAADTTEHIPTVDDRTDSFQQLNSDNAAVLEQQNITQGPSDVQLPSKPQEQPNVLSEPQDQQKVTQELMDITCESEPCQLDSGKILDSIEARTSFGDLGKFPVSHIDLFNSDQIKEHISSLRQSLGQPSSSNMMENPGENCCILCNMDKHYFGPAPLYCERCCGPIKHNSTYYWAQDEMGSKRSFCTKCLKVSRGCTISSLQGHTFSKAQLLKEKNNVKDEESWVQCDNCQHWMHQICGLYNAKRDQEGMAKYTCPYCRLEEIKLGKHVPSRDHFGARNLPRTKLSDHIEERLFRKLKREREDRAKFSNKDVDEVPGVGELLVRVVSSVDKIVKVNQDFLNIIPDQDYPTEFPHKVKVILLFQNIEGIDVCLFCMYVQEYGTNCDKPNQRTVYISYLDSIKYFRPDIRMVNGEALRTFVYHEILISYLDYCKSCGFAVCYIWACPPFKKEDYIFNCHPESQKIPKPDKLQQWYKSMLKKAMKEHVVVNYKTFYDAFIVQNEELSNKITVARLPYFDGDYWSDTAEITMRNLQKENGGEPEARMKKPLTKRTMKAMGHDDGNVDATNDIMVMQKLSQAMLPSKENFLVVQLAHICKKCQNLILSGDHCLCNRCKDLSFCSRCLEMDPNLRERNMHTSTAGEEHLVSKVAIELPADTEDKDIFLHNDIFENRHSFLGFCQGNNYQFNTIRRAKHSSMMILYDLSKQMKLIRKTACSTCHKDVLIQGQWHSGIGPKLHVGGTCCCKVSTDNHMHKLLNYFKAGCGVNKYEALPEKADEVQVRKVLEHASQCSSSQSNRCLQPECIKMKKLFRHVNKCNAYLAQGCVVCWRIWMLICLHSVRCKNTSCKVPRCRDAKVHINECSGQCRFCLNWRWFLYRTRCN